MTIRNIFILAAAILSVFILSACGPTTGPVPAATTPATGPALEEAGTSTPSSVPEGYPPPAPVPAAATALPVDYPAPPTMMPTPDPYPGGLVWVLRPVGIQCEEGTVPGYGDLREAQATMTAAGLTVVDAQMTDLMVTAVCGSPTSAHYRLQISAEDLQTAVSMGWTQES
jgi:hypothetical protein